MVSSASRVCHHNKHVTPVIPPTEHDVMIHWQVLALTSLQCYVRDLLWQAAAVLPNGTTEVRVGIEVVVAHQVPCCKLHDDVLASVDIHGPAVPSACITQHPPIDDPLDGLLDIYYFHRSNPLYFIIASPTDKATPGANRRGKFCCKVDKNGRTFPSLSAWSSVAGSVAWMQCISCSN